MKILFLTMIKIDSIKGRGIYTDLLRYFADRSHEIFIVSPSEDRFQKKTSLTTDGKVSFLQVHSLKLQKTNIIEKGVGQLLLEYNYLRAIKKNFSDQKFDLILYSTPPITFSKVISYIKRRDGAFSYLLLKDIFPQNAVDMKMMTEGSTIHKIFRKKEEKLYELSDAIGCMSEANRNYILTHNKSLSPQKVEVNPNTIEPNDFKLTQEEKMNIRLQYSIPLEKKVFIYGGNLGIPQGIDFLLQVIEKTDDSNVHFVIVGSGTEYDNIQKWFRKENPKNASLISGLPKTEYDGLLSACDVGLIFLHPEFTIPNFPSRLLSYLEMKMPVVTATDNATDIGKVVEKEKCGFWARTDDTERLKYIISYISSLGKNEFELLRSNAYALLKKEYLVRRSYELILSKATTPVISGLNGTSVKVPNEKLMENHFVD